VLRRAEVLLMQRRAWIIHSEQLGIRENPTVNVLLGARGGVLVKALRYKPAGSGFDSRWCHWNFSVK
jgi:hypothetical protein